MALRRLVSFYIYELSRSWHAKHHIVYHFVLLKSNNQPPRYDGPSLPRLSPNPPTTKFKEARIRLLSFLPNERIPNYAFHGRKINYLTLGKQISSFSSIHTYLPTYLSCLLFSIVVNPVTSSIEQGKFGRLHRIRLVLVRSRSQLPTS